MRRTRSARRPPAWRPRPAPGVTPAAFRSAVAERRAASPPNRSTRPAGWTGPLVRPPDRPVRRARPGWGRGGGGGDRQLARDRSRGGRARDLDPPLEAGAGDGLRPRSSGAVGGILAAGMALPWRGRWWWVGGSRHARQSRRPVATRHQLRPPAGHGCRGAGRDLSGAASRPAADRRQPSAFRMSAALRQRRNNPCQCPPASGKRIRVNARRRTLRGRGGTGGRRAARCSPPSRELVVPR